MLDLGIDLNAWPWIWLTVAVIFFVVELTVLPGSFVLLPFAISAFLASIAGFYDASVEAQWAVFIVVGSLLWILAYRFARHWITGQETPIGVGADRLVGTTGIVTVEIDPDDVARRGRVKLEGEVWGALSNDDAIVAEGTRVKVISVLGTRVLVQPITSSSTEVQEQP